MKGITFAPRQRLLVLAPHPDDETLTCGGLIQKALAAGADVRVVFATDGDDNPWPQRVVERRWRINAAARARWGTRRREEALAALATLGLDPESAIFLGWPDQGTTVRMLRHGEAMVTALADLLAWLPHIIATPSMADTHPDHSMLRLLLGAALRCMRCEAHILDYLVHGRACAVGPVLALAPAQVERKRAAALAHASQTVFGSGRLLRFVGATERFDLRHPAPMPSDVWHWHFDLPLLSRPRAWRALVVGWNAAGLLRAATVRLPWPAGRATVVDTQGRALGVAEIRRVTGGIKLALAPIWSDVIAIHAKIERDPRGWRVFDRSGWATPEPAALR